MRKSVYKVFGVFASFLFLGLSAYGQNISPPKIDKALGDLLSSEAKTLGASSFSGYKIDQKDSDDKPDRSRTFVAERTNRGTSTIIPLKVVIRYCSTGDGCEVRIAMHNWDNTGRIASRHFLFFYNESNGNWRSEAGDIEGTAKNNVTEHVNNSWACYFSDGKHVNWQNMGDTTGDFWLLSWNQFNADCLLTFVK